MLFLFPLAFTMTFGKGVVFGKAASLRVVNHVVTLIGEHVA